jgi:phage/plasmid-associated DNA primase
MPQIIFTENLNSSLTNDFTSLNDLLIANEVDNNEYYNYQNVISRPLQNSKGVMVRTSNKFLLSRQNLPFLFKSISTEKHTLAERNNFHDIPLYFDIDLKNKEIKHQYTEQNLKDIVNTLNTQIKNIYNVDDNRLRCGILEKEPYQKNEYWKNGFHLHYPFIFVNKEEFVKVVFERLKNEVKKLNFELDNAVYSNPWLLYNGAKDINLKPYLLTKFYDSNLNKMTICEALQDYHIYDEKEEKIDISKNVDLYLPNIMSLNIWHRDQYITEMKTQYSQELEVKKIKEKIEFEAKEIEKRKINKEMDTRSLDEKTTEVKEYLSLISADCGYKQWFAIAQVIYNIFDDNEEEAYHIFNKWSSTCEEKYNEIQCQQLWKTIKKSNSTIKTLSFYAKTENPEEYAKLNRKTHKPKIIFVDHDITLIDKLYNDSNGLGHHDFATIYKEANRDDIIFTTGYGYIIFDETTKLWSFNNTKNKLIYPLCQFFTKIMKKYQDHKITEFDDEKDLKIKAKKFKILTDIISNCGNTTFMNGVIAQLEGILTKPNSFVDIFDSKPHLFAFSDGYCIDMSKNGEKRKIEKEDYIMTTCGYPYPEKNEEIIKDANDILWSLTENEEQDKSLKSLMSLGFYGKNINELFIQMTGSGGNGKGLCATIMNNIYGSYYKEISPDQLTEYDKDKGRANSELADCRFARIVMTTEPKDGRDATLKTPMLKRWTGNDKIQARYLHKDAFEYTPKFTLMMQLNDQMDLSTCDDAIKRRLRVLGLEFSFVDDVGQELQPFEKFKDTTLKNKISQREFTDAFCHIMIDTYLREKGKFYESVKVKAKTSEFFDTQNPVKQWFLENYVACDEYEGISFFGREMFNKFRDDYPNKHLTETAFGRLLKEICKTKKTKKGQVYYCKRQSLVNQQNTLSTDLL